MNVELSAADLKILDAALDAWEKEGASESVWKSMHKLAGTGVKPTPEGVKQLFREGDKAKQDRRVQATFVRAKLYQAQNRASEHNVVHEDAGGGKK